MENCGVIEIYHKETCIGFMFNCIECNERSGNILKEEYFQNNEIKEGVYKSYYYNGKPCVICDYINGKKEGLFIMYDINGQIRVECYYIDDKKEGIYKSYWPNGQLNEIYKCNDGKMEGIYKNYDRRGFICEEANYINNERVNI
jgi:antitoxin component YwqK of YwqJK toxin-antitoxin module